jgi:nucleosome binding factor SPN SPT16 subunit
MYRNIRFAFFQPAENDMITLVHFHLHNPIMIGNKKTKDVQFYAEVGQDASSWVMCGMDV